MYSRQPKRLPNDEYIFLTTRIRNVTLEIFSLLRDSGKSVLSWTSNVYQGEILFSNSEDSESDDEIRIKFFFNEQNVLIFKHHEDLLSQCIEPLRMVLDEKFLKRFQIKDMVYQVLEPTPISNRKRWVYYPLILPKPRVKENVVPTAGETSRSKLRTLDLPSEDEDGMITIQPHSPKMKIKPKPMPRPKGR
jgi:hypothetical protein